MSFLGLDIAISALRANQYALNVTGHNIANAGTEGYHRQEAVFMPGTTTSGGTATSAGIAQLGTGVTIQAIRRMQTAQMDGQVRSMNQFLGWYSTQSESLRQVESVFGEPGGTGLSTVLDKFWNSWEELASNPDDPSARISVVESGVSLSDRFRALRDGLYQVQVQADRAVQDAGSRINTLCHDIAAINQELIRASTGQVAPNDLLDRRDILLDELSSLARIQVYGDGGGDCIVSVGGKVLVQGTSVTELTAASGPDGWSQLTWTSDGTRFEAEGGEVEGLTRVRSSMVSGYMQSLDAIATAVTERVNALYSTGVGSDGSPAGLFFSSGAGAASMQVNPALVIAPSTLATSTTGRPSDNQLARDIAGVKDEFLIDGQTIGDAYGSLVVRMGSHAREAETESEVHQVSQHYLITQRESMAGVSLDEEMINMVKFQQAYNAAARVVSVIDEMIETLVNRTGVAGR